MTATQAEIYANVRNKALEEAAIVADSCDVFSADALVIASRIRALKTSDKHPDCEDRCQLLEHKGYHTCSQTGQCEFKDHK